jgi:hypothetical protein
VKKKKNICAPALAFVFAWHRIGAIGAYEKQRKLSATVHDFLEQSCTVAESLHKIENRMSRDQLKW